MKRALAVALLAIGIAQAGSAYGDKLSDSFLVGPAFSSTTWLYQKCIDYKDVFEHPNIDHEWTILANAGICMSAIAGMNGVLNSLSGDGSLLLPVCSADARIQQLAMMYVKWIADDPSYLNTLASRSFIDMMLENYACRVDHPWTGQFK